MFPRAHSKDGDHYPRRRVAHSSRQVLRPQLTSTIVTVRSPRRPDSGSGLAAEASGPVDLGSAATTSRRESLCLNAYLMNHWSRSSIRVCLAGVASTAGCRAEMTTSSRWRPNVTEWPQAWRIMRLTTCRPRQTLRRQEFPKQSIGGARAVGRHLDRHAGPLTAQCRLGVALA
jgi:hypothetical protein